MNLQELVADENGRFELIGKGSFGRLYLIDFDLWTEIAKQ